MLVTVPIVHRVQHGPGLMYGEHRTFGQHIEMFVGYDRGDLYDEIGFRLEAGHFQVDPNEIFGGFHEFQTTKSGMVAERADPTDPVSGVGTVLASYGRDVLVQADGRTLHCALSGRKQRVVCGDRVAWSYPSSADGPRVMSVEPRRNLIERIDARARRARRVQHRPAGCRGGFGTLARLVPGRPLLGGGGAEGIGRNPDRQ